jgi:hypothetical protein
MEEVIAECVETKEREEKYIEFEKNWELNREDRYKDYLDFWTGNTEDCDRKFYISECLWQFEYGYVEALVEHYGNFIDIDFIRDDFNKMLSTHCKDVCVKWFDERISDLN